MVDSDYVKVIDVKNDAGVMKKQYSINLSKWSSKNFEGFKEGDRIIEGHTCQISVTRFGSNPKNNFINIDPADDSLRKAVFDMYSHYDSLKKK